MNKPYLERLHELDSKDELTSVEIQELQFLKGYLNDFKAISKELSHVRKLNKRLINDLEHAHKTNKRLIGDLSENDDVRDALKKELRELKYQMEQMRSDSDLYLEFARQLYNQTKGKELDADAFVKIVLE